MNGISCQTVTSGFLVSEVIITELLPDASTLLFNGDFTLLDNVSGAPLGWVLGTVDGGGVGDWVSVADAEGFTRRFHHEKRTVAGQGIGGISQPIYNIHATSRDRYGNRPIMDSPPAIEVGLTHKAASLVHDTAGSDFLGASIVIYYTTEDGTGVNVGRSDYYAGVGPAGITGGIDATVSGTGGAAKFGQPPLSWDWRRDVRRIPLATNEKVTTITVDIGIHDSDVTGEWWVGDIEVRPVA